MPPGLKMADFAASWYFFPWMKVIFFPGKEGLYSPSWKGNMEYNKTKEEEGVAMACE
ncbi:MAG: hypothetical protein M1379_07960 [Firmicutes bacterium]|nr:hypothetical protein [Bacillota bacterium]